jgi:predicted ATP-dependent protease
VVWVKNPTLEKVFGVADDNRRTMLIPGVGLVKGGAPGGPTLQGAAIQQAEGGFLVLDFMDVLRAPGLYQALMVAAKSGEVAMVEGGLEGLMRGTGETYHVPSQVKIVLIGSPSLRILVDQDPDFALNFQASVNFESTLTVSAESEAGYVQFAKQAVVSLAVELEQEVVNLTQDAMSALIEQGARLADSHKKLTAKFGALYAVVREATYWAKEAGRTEVRREDIDTALQAKQDREEGYRRRMLQAYKDNVILVETTGKKVGQINGLAVVRASFGVPMRITVVLSAAAGPGGIISVDRNAGPNQTSSSFNKALGVVEGFLQNLFAQKRPFPVRLSVAFEQNYGGIDGDSATSTEIYAILSALSGVPIGQNFAVTGSVDQFGNVQIIGGVNEKIEGFYELAKARGLTGDQGIVIPQANVANLQLSREVVEAVKAGKFRIYAVSHVSQGLEILTGVAYSEILAKARANLAEMGKPQDASVAKN